MEQIAVMLDSIDDEQTPLQKKLDQLGRTIAIGCVGSARWWRGRYSAGRKPVLEMIITGISLAVAAIPEGLPAIVTIASGAGGRPDGQSATRWSASAMRWKTLGCANVICSDKTGTLTENRMTVRRVVRPRPAVTGSGLELRGRAFLRTAGRWVQRPISRPKR